MIQGLGAESWLSMIRLKIGADPVIFPQISCFIPQFAPSIDFPAISALSGTIIWSPLALDLCRVLSPQRQIAGRQRVIKHQSSVSLHQDHQPPELVGRY